MQDETLATPLHTGELHSSLEDPALESMNFLNEIGLHYPDAISFASGRPFEEFFDVDLIHRYLDSFCGYLKDQLGYDDELRLAFCQLTTEQIETGLDRFAGLIGDVCPSVVREDTPTLAS